MKITKRDENSISWQDGNTFGSIGISEIAIPDKDDGPSTYDLWLDYCALRMKAEAHTVAETIAWMKAQWDVEPLERDHIQMRIQYASLVEEFCGDMLSHDPGDFSMEKSDEEFIAWHQAAEARRLEAEQLSEELSGLKMHGFELPFTERNRPQMEEDLQKFDERMGERSQRFQEHFRERFGDMVPPEPKKQEPRDCFLIFEETRRSLLISGVGAGIIGEKVIRYMGLTQEEIDSRSPRLGSYLMDGVDGLPSLEEFRQNPERYAD